MTRLDDAGRRTLCLVLPIYNTDKKLLRRCLASVAASWDDRLEVVAVDDGSDSAYAVWLDEAMRSLPFPCKLVHQNNGGQNAARAHGLKLSSSEWVMFLDSDDLLDDSVDCFLDYLDATEADVCVIGMRTESSDGEVFDSKLPPEQGEVSKERVLERCPSLCGFVARRELLMEGRCSLIEGPRIAEDIASAFKIIASAKSLTSFPFSYRYIMNLSSTTFQPHIEWMLDPIDAFRPLVESWEGEYRDLLAWTIVLHVRLLGCDRVMREVGLREGRELVEQLCEFSEPLYPGWQDSLYYRRYMQSLFSLERAKMTLVAKKRWGMYLAAMGSAKALAKLSSKLFSSSSTSNVYVLLRRILSKIGRGAS